MAIYRFNGAANENTLQNLTRDSRSANEVVSLSTGASTDSSNFSCLGDSIDIISDIQQKAIFVTSCFAKDRVKYKDAIDKAKKVELMNNKYANLFKE